MKKLNRFRRLVIQKALGLLFIALSILLIILACNGNDCGTPVVLTAPIGIGLLITNKTEFTMED